MASVDAIVANPETRSRFSKLLEMTTSPNDHEALIASRKASAFLAKHNTTYTDFLDAVAELNSRANITLSANRENISTKATKHKASNAHSFSVLDSNCPKQLQKLKRFLLSNFSLKDYERTLLQQLHTVAPNTKEAYLVLICAKRYGIETS